MGCKGIKSKTHYIYVAFAKYQILFSSNSLYQTKLQFKHYTTWQPNVISLGMFLSYQLAIYILVFLRLCMFFYTLLNFFLEFILLNINRKNTRYDVEGRVLEK